LILPLHLFWKIVIAFGIVLLNIICWLRFFCRDQSVVYRPGDGQDDPLAEGPTDANVIQQEEINSLTQELERICGDIDTLKDRIEHICTRAEQKVYNQTTDLNSIIRQLRRDANQDSMTGLANRRHFGQYSQHLFERARRDGSDLACMMVDIDNFKMVNDRFGHATGDCVIVMIGEILKASVRQGDLCARFGGDEFVMLLQNCSFAEARPIAERIRQEFIQKAIHIIKQSTMQTMPERTFDGRKEHDLFGVTGLSVGIATLMKNRPENLEQLMKMADRALYRAKQVGVKVI
jgi:diguanylate cyclase (GGDEF)-like protein